MCAISVSMFYPRKYTIREPMHIQTRTHTLCVCVPKCILNFFNFFCNIKSQDYYSFKANLPKRRLVPFEFSNISLLWLYSFNTYFTNATPV